MKKSLGLLAQISLGLALLAPLSVGHAEVEAATYDASSSAQPSYYAPWHNAYNPSLYNYWNGGYNSYYNTSSYYSPGYTNWNLGYNSWNYGWNPYPYGYGYNNRWPSNQYGPGSAYSYYGYPNGSYNPYGYNYGWNHYTSSGYDSLWSDRHYRYSNGYHYYLLDDGSYYVYSNNQWVYYSNSNRNNSSSIGYNALRNDSHYRYSNGYHYYVMDNGDYYYYANGQWVLVKADNNSGNTDNPSTPSEPTNPTDPSQPTEPSEPTNPSDPADPSQPTDPTTPSDPGLETPGYAPDTNIDYDQLPKPTLPPTDSAMQSDPRFVESGGVYYYRVATTDEERDRGIDGYYKWMGDHWKLFNGTDNNDPGLNPDLHNKPVNDEYLYDDNASSVTLYSENLVGTGQAGQALPFQNVDEFRDYVINNANPVFLDNSGWNCNVTWEIEDASIFESSKASAWSRDYVLIAHLKSGVTDENYKDYEFGHVKFVYRVEPTETSDYVSYEDAKVAFDEINLQRRQAGLTELTWSDDLYISKTLPHTKEISNTYNSEGIVFRRESDGKTVATKWMNSGWREVFLNPDITKAAVACVVAGDGTYYWTFNYE